MAIVVFWLTAGLLLAVVILCCCVLGEVGP